MRSKMSVCAQMSRVTEESKLLQYIVEFYHLRMRSKLSVCAQMSRVTEESKLLQYIVEFYHLRMRSKLSVCAQMSRVTDESKLPLVWLHNMLKKFLTLCIHKTQ